MPTFHDRLVLDHLFFDLPDGWVAARQVIANRYGSDHHPVLGLVFAADGGHEQHGDLGSAAGGSDRRVTCLDRS